MRVKSLEFKNIMGVREFSLEPGQITLISGKNAMGKSSVLSAIQTAIGGGNLATIRNLDATEDEQPEVSLVLESDTLGQLMLRKTASGLRLRQQVGDTAAFKDVAAPQRFIDALRDAQGSNPIEFLSAKPKERVDMVLRALDIDHTRDAFWSTVGLSPEGFASVPEGQHPLIEIDALRKSIFDERTGVNRDAKSSAAAADELRLAVPAKPAEPVDVESIREEISRLNLEAQKIESYASADYQRVVDARNDKYSQAKAQADSEVRAFRAELEADLERRVAEKKRLLEEKIQAIELISTIEVSAAQDARNKARTESSDLENKAAALEAVLSIANERAERAVKDAVLREQISRHEQKAEELKGYAARLTAALEMANQYKAALCSWIPVAGLTIENGDMMIDGRPWEATNEGRRLEIAVDVACMRFATLPDDGLRLVFVDGAEALDRENQDALYERIKSHGAQAFIACVSNDSEMKVEKIN